MSEKYSISPSLRKSNLVWIDLEMTGLNHNIDEILEAACMVTDNNLTIIAQSEDFVIAQSEDKLKKMDAWNQEHHWRSGLWEDVVTSTLTCQQAEAEMLSFLRQHAEEGSSPMCGNSVHQDRRFLAKFMPDLERFFHYRNLDVSTLKELVMRWYPKLPLAKDHSAHRSLSDIKDSIAELAYYRKIFFQTALRE